MREMGTSNVLCCVFCGKPEAAVKQLVCGPDGVAICGTCVERAYALVHLELPAKHPFHRVASDVTPK
jgi:ATP-dependent Clp protease ATP-binding subunit ClpX